MKKALSIIIISLLVLVVGGIVVARTAIYPVKDISEIKSISKEYNTLDLSEITDLNDEEIGGEYSPILVIYKPAKYIRGEYILDDLNYIYIKNNH